MRRSERPPPCAPPPPSPMPTRHERRAAHRARVRHPVGEREGDEDAADALAHHEHQRDDQHVVREGHDDVDDAAEHGVEPAAVVAGKRADERAEGERDEHDEEARWRGRTGPPTGAATTRPARAGRSPASVAQDGVCSDRHEVLLQRGRSGRSTAPAGRARIRMPMTLAPSEQRAVAQRLAQHRVGADDEALERDGLVAAASRVPIPVACSRQPDPRVEPRRGHEIGDEIDDDDRQARRRR